jgi:hypothetical protein
LLFYIFKKSIEITLIQILYIIHKVHKTYAICECRTHLHTLIILNLILIKFLVFGLVQSRVSREKYLTLAVGKNVSFINEKDGHKLKKTHFFFLLIITTCISILQAFWPLAEFFKMNYIITTFHCQTNSDLCKRLKYLKHQFNYQLTKSTDPIHYLEIKMYLI